MTDKHGETINEIAQAVIAGDDEYVSDMVYAQMEVRIQDAMRCLDQMAGPNRFITSASVRATANGYVVKTTSTATRYISRQR